MWKDYATEILGPTILLGFLTAMVGVAASLYYLGSGNSNSHFTLLVLLDAVLAQIAISLINDFHDYTSGIDKETVKTRFSGGSHMLVNGLVKPEHVLWIGEISALASALIGIFLSAMIGPIIFVPMLIGGIAIFVYTRYITKLPFVQEPFVMIAFILIGVGAYIVAHNSLGNISNALFAIIPAGIISGVVLFINEIPDAEVHKKYGRKHAVIMLNSDTRVAEAYLAMMAISYIIVIFGVVRNALPIYSLLVLITIPVVLYVASGILEYTDPASYETYMGYNLIVACAYLFLFVVAFGL